MLHCLFTNFHPLRMSQRRFNPLDPRRISTLPKRLKATGNSTGEPQRNREQAQTNAAAESAEGPQELDEDESYEDDWYGEMDEEKTEPVFEVIYVNCWLDGCTCFEEITTCLRGYQKCFRELQEEGWMLASERVHDGLVHITKGKSGASQYLDDQHLKSSMQGVREEGLRVGQEGQEDVTFEANKEYEEEGGDSGDSQDDETKEKSVGEAEIPEVEGFEGYAAQEEALSELEDPSLHDVVMVKWLLDNCKDLDEIIERIQENIQRFEHLQNDGWVLKWPGAVDNGRIPIIHPQRIAERRSAYVEQMRQDSGDAGHKA